MRTSRIIRPSLSALTCFAGLATACPDAQAFGGTARELERQGNFVITNNAGFGFSHRLNDPPADTVFVLRPALDYFVINNLSIGGAVEFLFTSPPPPPPNNPSQPNTTRFVLAPEIGYEAALSDTFSFWPQAALAMTFPNPGDPTVTLIIRVPFLIHPAEHFFFGIGPGFSQDLTAHPATVLSGDFTIGGYFDH